MSVNEQKEIFREVIRRRSQFLTIKSKLTKLVEPKIFALLQGNLQNIRNLIIVSGALASFGLLALKSFFSDYLIVGIISSLFFIVFAVWQLNKESSESINRYHDKLKENIAIADEGEKIINNYLDGKMRLEVLNKKLLGVYERIEMDVIRSKNSANMESKKKIYVYDLLTVLFVLPIVILIIVLFFRIFE